MSRFDFYCPHSDPNYDFVGPPGSFTATAADNSPWRIADTSSAGTPTYTLGNTGNDIGALTLAFDSQAEPQNVCLYQSDLLQFDIDQCVDFTFRVKMGQAALDSATSLAVGVCSARNDAIDSLAAHASFRVIGATSTTAVFVETDDGTTDNDDVATGKTLINAYKVLQISFAAGKGDVRFYIDGQPVATSTTFSMAAYSAGLQMYMQLQKTSDNNTDAVTIDYAYPNVRRVVR